MFVFHLTAWLGSFLLFHLELLVAKLLLPSFGGSAYVWTTCVMTYQGLLLAGYAAYRWLAQCFGVAGYAPWHVGLLLAGLLWLPRCTCLSRLKGCSFITPLSRCC